MTVFGPEMFHLILHEIFRAKNVMKLCDTSCPITYTRECSDAISATSFLRIYFLYLRKMWRHKQI